MPEPQLEFRHRYVPPKSADSGFTVLLLHGTGGDENDLLPLGPQLAPGAGLLSPRGKVLENGMPRFFRRLAEGVFDEKDVAFRAGELAQFVEAASAQYGFDPARVVAAGYSNGANIAAAVMLLHPMVLAAAALFRPMLPLVPSITPDLSGKRAFLSAGRRDPIVPRAQTDALASLLTAAGAAVDLEWRDAGHELTQEDIVHARDWLSSQRL